MDTASFQGHSVHSTAYSAAKKLDVSSAEIVKVADWSRESTFIKFYHKPTNRTVLPKEVSLEGLWFKFENSPPCVMPNFDPSASTMI